MLPPDIERRVRSEAKEDAEEFIRRLSAFAIEYPDFGDRVLRCVVYSARGKLDHLESAMALARLDPRDAIVAAEYDSRPGTTPRQQDLVQIRDMNLPFE